MKKFHSILATCVLLAGVLSGCAGGQQAGTSGSGGSTQAGQESTGGGEKYPNQPINLIVSYSAGGGTDTSARILQPYLEKELGVTVNILNKPGGGGWVGWTELAHAEPDGYTIGYINSPNVVSGYLNPSAKREENLDSFEFLGNQVSNPEIIAIRTDEQRFTDIKGLIEYAKNNELTATGTGVAGDDHIASLLLNKNFGTKFRAVQFEGTAESRTGVLGGHVDVLFASVDEVFAMHNNKELKVIAVMDKERSPFLPDVPTLQESGYDGVFMNATRGIAAPKGLDPEKVKILSDAIEKAIKNEEHVAKLEELGIAVRYLNGEEYRKDLMENETTVRGIFDLLGW
jgi:tripartite-type tricarboxylate transporter receptor subunit TctC